MVDVKKEADAFAAKNVIALAQEMLQWRKTGLLPTGKLSELENIWRKQVDGTNDPMGLAESTAIRAALEKVAGIL